ncbi:MAG: TonB-dependent receptor domain-containing protein [Lewinella sp.]|uniref:TonB-dependent receptor domain-containing protein n=1 Tax=Lewinella sp. TaxID=2004506 RepID=UPI003D6A3606
MKNQGATLGIGLLVLLLTLGGQLQGQSLADKRIKYSYEDKALDMVFFDLKLGERLNFEFDASDVKGIVINQTIPRMPLEEALGYLLKGTGLIFELQEPRTIIISKDPNFGKTALDPSEYTATRNNISISGTLKDKASGETLPYAAVLVVGTGNGVSTNGDGYFTLQNVPSDTAVLEVQYLGYHTEYYRLTPENTQKDLRIEMEVIGQQLEAVIVIAEQEEQLLKASTGVSKVSITPAAIATLPSFGEKDIFRSLQLLPGISGSNESSSGLYVRGGTPDQNLILFDDFTVYHVDHLFGFFSAFNSNAIKDVQLYKGGFGAKYGGRLSSVVELTGKDGNSQSFNAGMGLSLLSINGFIESPFANGKGSFLIAGRRSFQSSFYSNLFNDFTDSGTANATTNTGGGGRPGGGRFGQQEVEPSSYFYDLNGKATYRLNDKDILSLSFYNGQDHLDNSRNTDNSAFGNRNVDFSFDRENTDLTNWGNWGSALKWSRRWNDKFYSNLNLSYSNYFSERDRSDITSVNRTDTSFTLNNGSLEYNNLRDYSLKLDNEWQLTSNNRFDFGFQSSYNDIEYLYRQNDTLDILNRVDQGLVSTLYVQDRQTIAQKWILTGGLRTTHYSVTNKLYVEPRASMTYLLSDAVKLKGAWGKYNQFATRIVREDIQQGSRDFWLLADDQTVPISSATHYILGASYEVGSYLFDVEMYRKNLDGLSEYTTRFTPSGFGPNASLDYEEFFYTGSGVAKGVEVLAQKKLGLFTGWIGYTLGQVKYDFDAFGDEPFYANQDQTHELKLVGNYKHRNWTFGASFIYASGRPYTAPTGFYEVPLLDGSTASFFEVSDKNAYRLPAYHRLDLSSTYEFDLVRSKASFGLSVYNLYGRKNLWYKEYDVVEGELLETNVSLLGFTPSLFFNWSLR